jgi:hypothetical protein
MFSRFYDFDCPHSALGGLSPIDFGLSLDQTPFKKNCLAFVGAPHQPMRLKGQTMKKTWILGVLIAGLFTGCSGSDVATKAYSLHPRLTLKVGEGKLVGGDRESGEFVLYRGLKDTVATVGWKKTLPKYRGNEYNPREYEEGLQYVDGTPGSNFYLRGIGKTFEIISCDAKTVVIRLK